ncbi:MAG: choice-of-anchor B family protein [Bacteroidota bacterium]|jgi:choice-of-anchor B domain-containing protein
MKKFYFPFFFLITISLLSQNYSSFNVSLLGNLNPCTVNNWYANGSNTKYSSVIGWANPIDGKEYAILGGTDGYYFIDVSNPSSPVLRDFEPGVNSNCLWREMKTYGKYCYLVSDDNAPNGLIIADLSYLPDSVHIVHKSNSILIRSHTIFVDGNKLYGGYVHTSTGAAKSMAVYSLNNPAAPQPLRYLDQDYPNIGSVHDMWVQQDTVFASCGYDGLHVYKYDSIQNKFFELASYTGYIQAGYNHSSFRTADRKTLVFCDEVPANTVVKILDVSNLNNLTLLDTIKSNQGATPHNPYIVGNNLCYVAYYQDGLYIFDISNPSNVSIAGYFDTHYQNGLNNNYPSFPTTYMGAWAADPFLPSGNVLVSDMQNGLFVLDVSLATGISDGKSSKDDFIFFPNPSSDFSMVKFFNSKDLNLLEVFDYNGRKILEYSISKLELQNGLNLKTIDLASGVYFVKISGDNKSITKKLIKN